MIMPVINPSRYDAAPIKLLEPDVVDFGIRKNSPHFLVGKNTTDQILSFPFFSRQWGNKTKGNMNKCLQDLTPIQRKAYD